MTTCLRKLPDSPTFTQNGLKGFQFPLDSKGHEIYFVDSSKGHDDFVIAEKITHTYYILGGIGYFEIDGRGIEVTPGMLLEIPPLVEFSYSGEMKLLLFMSPPFSTGKVRSTRSNPKILS